MIRSLKGHMTGLLKQKPILELPENHNVPENKLTNVLLTGVNARSSV